MSRTPSQPILLQNGTLLLHNDDDHVEVQKTDLLITDGHIAQIDDGIKAPPDAEVIDCSDKIISPGFIDTHHHVWQSLLKGRHANHTLLQYMPEGNFTSSLHDPHDIFWGQLAGCLEMLDCGTTTVVDFAHLNYSPEHDDQAIDATIASGIRSVFCYCPTPLATSWTPFDVEMNSLGGHVLPTFSKLASQAPWADGRVTLGFAFDAFQFLPPQYLSQLMDQIRQYNIDLITFHYVHGVVQAPTSIAGQLNELGILDKRWLVAHSSNLTQEDAVLYAKLDVHVSSTPSTELQMSMGVPVAAFKDSLGHDLPQRCSLGVDCHSATSSYIPFEARLGLQSARAVYGEKFLEQRKQTASVHYDVEEAFNLATIRGARAAKVSAKTGSIAVGKAADLVVFSATTPCMLAAAQHDPVAAIILHSSPADVDTVIVDGLVRKQNGKLKPSNVSHVKVAGVSGSELEWKDVAKEVLRRQAIMSKKIEGVDLAAAQDRLIDIWHIDRTAALSEHL